MPDGAPEPERRSRLRWRGDEEFSLDGVDYVCRPRFDTFDSTPERFCIRKPRTEVERLERLLARLRPRRIFELGVHKGGSTALIAQLADPEKLVAIDRGEPESGAGLAGLVAARGLEGSVSVHWEVDQADRARLAALIEAELGGAPLDLVIDDASHFLAPSRASFDALFPHLRPGGEYLIEDWSWAHAAINLWPDRPPLTNIVVELMIASAHRPELLAAVEVDRAWARARRGEAEVEADRFELRAELGEDGQAMVAALGRVSGERRPPRWRRLIRGLRRWPADP